MIFDIIAISEIFICTYLFFNLLKTDSDFGRIFAVSAVTISSILQASLLFAWLQIKNPALLALNLIIVILYVVTRKSISSISIMQASALSALVATTFVIATNVVIRRVAVTPDSLSTLANAGILQAGKSFALLDYTEVLKRGFALPSLESLNPEILFIPALPILLFLNCCAVIFHLIWSLRHKISHYWIATLTAFVLLLGLVGTEMGYLNLFYINSHLLVALMILIATTTCILYYEKSLDRYFLLVASSALTVLALSRIEALLLGVMCVLPTLTRQATLKQTCVTIGIPVLVSTIWLGLIIKSSAVTPSAINVIAMNLSIIALVAAATLITKHIPWLTTEILLLITFFTLLLIVISKFWENFRNSLPACFSNVTSTGGWGTFLVISLILITLSALLGLARNQTLYLLFTILTMTAVLYIIKPFDIGEVCNSSWGNSINRMWYHISFLLILYVTLVAGGLSHDKSNEIS